MLNEFNYFNKEIKSVDIYLLKIEDNIENIDKNIIPNDQLLDICKYKFEHDRNKRLLARSFLFSKLKNKYQIEDFSFEYNKFKKPYIKRDSHIDFSISYSKDYVLIAISDKYKIGADIEYIDKDINHDDIKDIIMHREEINYYSQLDTEEDKIEFFFDVFNVKESIIKSMGMGLYFDVKEINTLKVSQEYLTRNIFGSVSDEFKTSLNI